MLSEIAPNSSPNSPFNPIDAGRHLMRVRERAGLKQAEVARRVSLSPAVLSRIEAGERHATLQEVQDILAQIEGSESAELSRALGRTWTVLPRPPLDHPDQEILWEAEQIGVELLELREKPDTPYAFERRLTE